MDLDVTEKEVATQLQERFAQLPQVVQKAITSADVQQHLRELAKSHQLHLDQWQVLENEVMLTLLGLQEPETLAVDLKNDLGIDESSAHSLAEDISSTVFQPIRERLEQELAAVSVLDQQGQEAKAVMNPPVPVEQSAPQPVFAATPAAVRPVVRAARAPISSSYGAGQASTERKVVEGDPYRESPA